MSKRKLEVPPLRLNPDTERSTRALMARMRAPTETVDVHQDTSQAPNLKQVDVHQKATQAPQVEQVDVHQDTIQTSTTEIKSLHQIDQQTSTRESADIHQKKSGHLTALVDAYTSTKKPLMDAYTSTKESVDVHQKKSGQPRAGDRHDSSKTRHTIRLKQDISERFRVFCVKQGLDFQDFIELAGVHFLECGRPPDRDLVDAQTSHDDLKIYRSHEDIIRLYQTLTGNRWKPADDREGIQFANTDRRIIEIGMLQTLLNFKGKRINSFKYFVPEIQAVEDETREVRSSDEQIEAVLRRRRQMWEGKQAEKENR